MSKNKFNDDEFFFSFLRRILIGKKTFKQCHVEHMFNEKLYIAIACV